MYGMPLGSGMFGMDQMLGMGGLGTVPGMGQVPGMELGTSPTVMNGAGMDAFAGAGSNPMSAALGMDALKMLQPKGMQAPPVPGSPGIAPRGNQVQVSPPTHADQIDPRVRLGLAQLLFGGAK
jgi:hypothetical protein